MTKEILAVDFGGTFISNKAADIAHYQWFKVMAMLLNKPEIEKYAGDKDYFKYVYKIMEDFTGLNQENEEHKNILKRWARSLFAFITIGEVKKLGKNILFKDFANYLRELKPKYSLAVVSSQPQDSILPILSILGCEDIFDYIYESSFYEEPDKYLVLSRFVNENGKPLYYIGNSSDDLEACRKLKIPLINVTWDKQDLSVNYRKKDLIGDFVINNVEELKKIINDSKSMPKVKNKS